MFGIAVPIQVDTGVDTAQLCKKQTSDWNVRAGVLPVWRYFLCSWNVMFRFGHFDKDADETERVRKRPGHHHGWREQVWAAWSRGWVKCVRGSCNGGTDPRARTHRAKLAGYCTARG